MRVIGGFALWLPSWLVAIAAGAPAQVFVVDAAGGAGSHYRDLPAAVAAVPSGSVLIVRAGTYTAFQLANKSLAILGVDATTVRVVSTFQPLNELRIGPLATDQQVLMENVTLQHDLTAAWIDAAAGPVTLRSLRLASPQSSALIEGGIVVRDSPNVRLHDSILGAGTIGAWISRPRLTLERSRMEVSACRLLASPRQHAAIYVIDSHLVISRSDVQGGKGRDAFDPYPSRGYPGSRGGDGIYMTGTSSVHALTCFVLGGAGGDAMGAYEGGPGGDGIQDTATGRVRCDGFLPMGGPPGTRNTTWGLPVGGGGDVRVRSWNPTPALTVLANGQRGSPFRTRLTAAAGSPVVLMLGYQPLVLPLPDTLGVGDLLVLPALMTNAYIVPASGTLDFSVPLHSSFTLHEMFFAQGIELDLARNELEGTNSVFFAARQ